MTALPNARYERKQLASGLTLQEALAMVRRHPAAFRQAYPEREVNNIYLDSPTLASYREHVNGAPERLKMRVRWYGPSAAAADRPALEEKLKRGALSGKAVHALPPLRWNGAALRLPLGDAFGRASLPEQTRARLRQLEPSLFNRYRRHYFVSADGRFRLTVDFGLEFERLTRASGAPRTLLSGGPLVIMELKYAPQDADRAAAVTNGFPFRVKRCSKYVLGIEHSARS